MHLLQCVKMHCEHWGKFSLTAADWCIVRIRSRTETSRWPRWIMGIVLFGFFLFGQVKPHLFRCLSPAISLVLIIASSKLSRWFPIIFTVVSYRDYSWSVVAVELWSAVLQGRHDGLLHKIELSVIVEEKKWKKILWILHKPLKKSIDLSLNSNNII